MKMNNPTDEEVKQAQKALGLDPDFSLEVNDEKLMRNILKVIKDDCPVCFAKDVVVDLLAHGPGVGILEYGCGCLLKAYEGKTLYCKFDGTFREETK